MSIRATFALIGPGKSGTTAMYTLLTRHPQVVMAKVKETCFFNDHWQRGEAWYHSLFPPTRDARAVGEVSNTYIFSADAAARMSEYYPAMRAVASLRNPVDRAFSHWLFLRRNAEVSGTFEECLTQRPDLLDRGQYARLLDPWFTQLGRDRVLVLVFDDFVATPLPVYNRMLQFIGVDAVAQATLDDSDRLAASAPRSTIAARAVKFAANAVRRAGRPEVIQWVKDSPIPRLLYRTYSREERPTMDPATRQKLNAHFAPDVKKLGALMDRDLCALWGLSA